MEADGERLLDGDTDEVTDTVAATLDVADMDGVTLALGVPEGVGDAHSPLDS